MVLILELGNFKSFSTFLHCFFHAKLTLQTYYLFLPYKHESSFESMYKIQLGKIENFTDKLLKNL